MSGWRGVVGVWPALCVCGGSFAAVQFAVSNYHGPWLVDVAGGLVSLISLACFLRFWKPKQTWRFADESSPEPSTAVAPAALTRRQIISAWVPWMLLTVFVFLWGLPQVKEAL